MAGNLIFTETRFFSSQGSVLLSSGYETSLGSSASACLRAAIGRTPKTGLIAETERIRTSTAEFSHVPVYVKIFIINWAGGGAVLIAIPSTSHHSELIFKKKNIQDSTRASRNPTACGLRRLGNTRLERSPTAQTPQGQPRPSPWRRRLPGACADPSRRAQ